MFEWDRNAPEHRSGPFKRTRLMVKLHQAYALASKGLAPDVVWPLGSARTRWKSLQRSPTPLSALTLLAPSALDPRRLASRLRRSKTERCASSFFPIPALPIISGTLYHTAAQTNAFYPNVTTLRSGLCCRNSVSLSVCLSVVCNVGAPYSRG